MKKKWSNWFNAERVDRAEKGTSQDMCPTNGAALLYSLVMTAAWLPVTAYMGICLYLGLDPFTR